MVHLSWEHVREHIAGAEDVAVLRAIREQAHETYRDPLLFADFDGFHVGLNQVHDALIQRSVELAVRRLEQRDLRAPQLTYAFLLFGSGGRSEQTLWSDQDNGLVYEDPRGEEEAGHAGAYFEQLAAEIHRCLFAVGYPPCTGEVLAGNPMWRKPYSEYVRMVQDWMEGPDWERIRYLLIFSDIRCIHGSRELAEKLRHVHLDYAHKHPELLHAMLRNTLHHKVSLGVFGQLITERYGADAGGVDIKYGAYIPIVNGIRLLTVKAGIAASSTLERIEALQANGIIPPELAADYRRITRAALQLRAMTPYQLENNMYTTRGKLPAEALSKQLRDELKQILRSGRRLQRYVRHAVEGDD